MFHVHATNKYFLLYFPFISEVTQGDNQTSPSNTINQVVSC